MSTWEQAPNHPVEFEVRVLRDFLPEYKDTKHHRRYWDPRDPVAIRSAVAGTGELFQEAIKKEHEAYVQAFHAKLNSWRGRLDNWNIRQEERRQCLSSFRTIEIASINWDDPYKLGLPDCPTQDKYLFDEDFYNKKELLFSYIHKKGWDCGKVINRIFHHTEVKELTITSVGAPSPEDWSIYHNEIIEGTTFIMKVCGCQHKGEAYIFILSLRALKEIHSVIKGHCDPDGVWVLIQERRLLNGVEKEFEDGIANALTREHQYLDLLFRRDFDFRTEARLEGCIRAIRGLTIYQLKFINNRLSFLTRGFY